MSRDPECIFCKIVAGEIPSFKLCEDEATLAFMDINPLNDGHALVICKDHHPNIYETPAETLAEVVATVRRVARAIDAALAPAGLNVMQANGPAAGQSVYHFHMHVLPRREDDDAKINWGLVPGDMERIKALAEKIKEKLEP